MQVKVRHSPEKRENMKKKRSVCPVACTLDLLGDRWTLLVVRDLFAGKQFFGQFVNSPEGIATNILTERLERLVSQGLVRRFRHEDFNGKEGYSLTDKGYSLGPVLEAVADWGLKNIRGTQKRVAVQLSRR